MTDPLPTPAPPAIREVLLQHLTNKRDTVLEQLREDGTAHGNRRKKAKA